MELLYAFCNWSFLKKNKERITSPKLKQEMQMLNKDAVLVTYIGLDKIDTTMLQSAMELSAWIINKQAGMQEALNTIVPCFRKAVKIDGKLYHIVLSYRLGFDISSLDPYTINMRGYVYNVTGYYRQVPSATECASVYTNTSPIETIQDLSMVAENIAYSLAKEVKSKSVKRALVNQYIKDSDRREQCFRNKFYTIMLAVANKIF